MAIKRITTNLIKDSDIATVDIANNAITAAKITDGNITTAKLADLSVTTGKLAGTLDLTGKTITVATTTTGDSDTSPASTAFVQQEIAALVDSSPSSLNTLNELAAALGDDASFSTTVTNSIALKAPLASPTFTGTGRMNGDWVVGAATGEDKFVTAPQAAGSGTILISYNDAGNAYEPLTVDFETIALRTSGTPRLSIDAGGRVMIAETSNSGYSNNADDLIVGDNGAATERGISIGSTAGGGIRWNDGADAGIIQYVHSSNAMQFYTANSLAATIDSAGTMILRADGAANIGRIQFSSQAATYQILGGNNLGYLGYKTGGYHRFFGSDGTTAAVIDGSKRLVVGATSPFSADSVTIDQGGFLAIRNTSASGMEVRRDGTDGKLIDFQKDGASVGSIGVSGGNNIYISSTQTNHAGLTFATDAILPTRQEVGIDNVTDLGASSERFKDLYLSGGAYLGGTGAANKLDDYEEGTWTPDLTFGGVASGINWNTQTGKYVKIGSVVHLFCLLFEAGGRGSQTGTAQLTGLPFATSSSSPDSWIPLTNRSGITVNSTEQLALFLPTNTQSPSFYISRTVAGTNTTATHANFSASGVF